MTKEETKKKAPYTFPMPLGRYTLLKLVGEGGMGEVFLAEDPVCQRKVALKRLLEERKKKPSGKTRFVREVRIAAKLAHPSIIPIYDLHEEDDELYYTMPYLEGETLKMILLKTRIAMEEGFPPQTIGGSIPSLMLAFLNICQAVEHTHSKGFLHRDLKPENIIVGKYNEVTILDWGVAVEIASAQELEGEGSEQARKARVGAGTIEYMAPEQAFHHPATVQTDIYSLGVILHFILTLQTPYKRPSTLKEWREQLKKEGAEPPIDPQEAAPYREITAHLSRMTLKCLHPDPEKRYKTVRELITDVEHYIQGRPDWVPMQQLEINRLKDWEFQESVLLTKQMAISRYAGVTEWVHLMLSKESYSGNIQVEATVRVKEGSSGVGFLLCVPDDSGRAGLQKGYLVWIGSKENPGCKLLRDNVEVKRVDGVFLKPGELYQISVQRQDTIFRLHINDEQKLLYSSYVPLMGGHFGLVSKDAEFEISPLTLSSGSQNVLVNCLSVPDAFLLNKDYERALTEYRRIASSFKGRPEGREAIFRAGITLIEEKNFEGALSEFERLDKTPGAPIEYLGKSLVYQAEKNLEEEIKCLELGLRKFPKHPLRTVLDDHILYRLHETAQKDRVGAYAFTLLSLRHLPNIVALNETKSLTQNLKVSWEELPFIVYPPLYANEKEEHLQLSIQLSFWLSRPNSLYELIESFPEKCKHWMTLLQNGLLSLYHLGYPKLIDYILTKKYGKVIDPKFTLMKNLFEVAIDDLTLPQKLDLVFSKGEFPLVVSLLEKGLTIKTAPLLFPYFKKGDLYEIERLWALLLSGKKKEAGEILDKKHYIDPPSITAMIKGCYLAMTEGEEAAYAHFAPLIETAHPPTSSLLGHYLKGHISLDGPWFKGAFFWEKIQLYRQLALYYHCLGNASKAAHFEEAIEKATTENQLPLNFI